MDDLDGLFGGAGSSPMVAQQPPMQGMGLMPNNVAMMQNNMTMAQGDPNMLPITPTQTTAATATAQQQQQLNNKSQILNQFQANSGQQMYMGQPGMGQMGMMGAPARPAPVVPNQGNMFPAQQQFMPGQQMMQQQPQNFLTVPGPAGQFTVPQEQTQQQMQGVGSSGNLILSNSFTEPGPVDLDPMADPFAESPKSEVAADLTDGGSSFYIDENEITTVNKEEAKAEDGQEEGMETPEPDTPVTPQPKTSFWSRWSRNKEAGSKENILDESDKKATNKDDEGKAIFLV